MGESQPIARMTLNVGIVDRGANETGASTSVLFANGFD